jgi:hypothetical protein
VRRVDAQDLVERRLRIGSVVLLEEKLADEHAWLELRRVGAGRLIERLERVLEELRLVETEIPAGDADGSQLLGRQAATPRVVDVDEAVEAAHGFVALTAVVGEHGEVDLRGQAV